MNMVASNDVQMNLTDGRVCRAQFAAGAGVDVSKEGQPVGTIAEAEMPAFAAEEDGASALAEKVENFFSPDELVPLSKLTLIQAAREWLEGKY